MRRIVSLCFFLWVADKAHTQNPTYKPDILPHSPEAAAFAKNVNIPVSYSSGTPQIGVPFYSVKSGSMEVPVSINYNASGIRVEEVPTWVGLGWSLSAGGQITRTVRGKPDETISGYMNVAHNRSAKYVDSIDCRCGNPSNQTTERQTIENELNTYHTLDLEPDQFSFSVMGYSGDFYWNQDSAKFVLVPFQNIQIGGTIGSFVLTLPNGLKCYFGETSASTEVLQSGTTASYVDDVSSDATALGDANYATSWMLTSLHDLTGKIIQFTYASEYIISFNRGGEQFGTTITEPSITKRQSFSKQYIQKPVLLSILGENANVYFKQSSAHRLDIPDYLNGSRSLDTLVVTTTNNSEIKSYYFRYGYFTSPSFSTTSMLNISTYGEEARKRLYLQSITEKSGGDSLPPYEFTYNETELPSRLSSSQDYWGYYNGKPNSVALMPRIPAVPFYPWLPNYSESNHVLPQYGTYLNSGGADRRIDTAFTQARMLTKIKYPTGGSTEYFYEQNDASINYLNVYGGMEPPDMIERSYVFSSFSNPLPVAPPYPLDFTGTFHISAPTTQLSIVPQLPTCSTNYDASCILTVKLWKLPDSALLTTIQTTNTISMQVESGDYRVEVLVNGSTNDYPPNFNVAFQWGERMDTTNFIVGGVRVKKIITRDGVNNTIARSYRYRYDGTSTSSGIIEGCPTYKVHDVNYSLQPVRQYYVSSSVLPLTESGKTVRYEFVSEYMDSVQSSMKTNYTFSSGITDPRKFAGAKSPAPMVSWSWQNNLLKRKQVFEKTGASTYRVLIDEQHYYLPHNSLYYMCGLSGSQIIPYYLSSDWYLPDSATTLSYAYSNNQQISSQSGVRMLYNDWFLPAVTRTTNSKGQTVESKTWYPTDYNNVSGYNLSTLYNNHAWELPIKQESTINGKVTAGTIHKYNSVGQAAEVYAYESPALSDTVAHNRNTVLETNYQLRASLSYDANDNLAQIDNYKSGPLTYIWDYQVDGFTSAHINEYPMASVQNADQNSVAYTSFENASTGNWSYSGSPALMGGATMGKKAYSLSGGSVQKSGLNSNASYIVSYWSTGQQSVNNTTTVSVGMTTNAGWTYYQHRVVNPSSGVVTVSGTGTIDELRLYPETAQMTTFGYSDLWQLASGCDANSKILYYEYDIHGRLSLVRDARRNVLKKFCYNYAGQSETCGLGTDAQWQVVSSVCEQVGGINTGNQIKTEKDTNPNSGTHDQTRTITVPNACFVCTASNCSGIDKKCINNQCETGIRVNDGSVRSGRNQTCYYHYQWSDASVSPQYSETITLSQSCPL